MTPRQLRFLRNVGSYTPDRQLSDGSLETDREPSLWGDSRSRRERAEEASTKSSLCSARRTGAHHTSASMFWALQRHCTTTGVRASSRGQARVQETLRDLDLALGRERGVGQKAPLHEGEDSVSVMCPRARCLCESGIRRRDEAKMPHCWEEQGALPHTQRETVCRKSHRPALLQVQFQTTSSSLPRQPPSVSAGSPPEKQRCHPTGSPPHGPL